MKLVIFDELDEFETRLGNINLAAACHDLTGTITQLDLAVADLTKIRTRLVAERAEEIEK